MKAFARLIVANAVLSLSLCPMQGVEIARKSSPALAEVVKMVDSGVTEDVVLSYIQNNHIPKPKAEDVIYLHDEGVPNSVIMALLAKKETPVAAPAAPAAVQSEPTLAKPVYAQAPAAPAVVQAPPTTVYVQQEPAVVYSTPVYYYSSPVYYRTPYCYSYPYYRGYYGYGWPGISVGFNFGRSHSFRSFHHGFGGHRSIAISRHR